MPLPTIDPPLLNSANPWCSSLSDLEALHQCPHTGAITTRTSLLHGFPHDPALHQHTFFSPSTQTQASSPDYSVSKIHPSSLNTLGYSPHPLSQYLTWVEEIVSKSTSVTKKPWIISITGSASEIVSCCNEIYALKCKFQIPLAVEINLSCPNIANKPPPAYSGDALKEYLNALRDVPGDLPIGLKTPPYTYAGQFEMFVTALREADRKPDFVTATNTLGSCLLLGEGLEPVLASAAGTGIGGLAGESLHPLALGNVATLKRLFDAVPELKEIEIVGVGGVSDRDGFARMRAAGAKYVGVGTALGREGTGVFGEILGLETRDT